MQQIALAVIGGTGVYNLAKLDDVQTHEVETRFGRPSGPVRVGTLLGNRVAFLARHGEGHSLPPHKINYRANLAALQQIGAQRVLALNTVGGIGGSIAAGLLPSGRCSRYRPVRPGAALPHPPDRPVCGSQPAADREAQR